MLLVKVNTVLQSDGFDMCQLPIRLISPLINQAQNLSKITKIR